MRDLGNGSVEIGAMMCAQLIGDEAAGARSILGEVASKIADVQVRNRGTVGGNVCSNDIDESPAAAPRGARRASRSPDPVGNEQYEN